MSADNWAICPKCMASARAQKQLAIDAAAMAYGKADVDVFIKLRERANRDEDEFLKDITGEEIYSFREDYQIGVEPDGEFFVKYSGQCKDCGFSHSYEFKQHLKEEIKGKKCKA